LRKKGELKKTITDMYIKLKSGIDSDDYVLISELKKLCENNDKITLKTELDYKLADSEAGSDKKDISRINEFMCFDDKILAAYIGICGFASDTDNLEITGMVHPIYRRRGIFSSLFRLAAFECAKRGTINVLLLCDKKSLSGQAFLKKIGAAYKHSEFEMYSRSELNNIDDTITTGIDFVKALNKDANIVARLNALLFDEIKLYENEENEKNENIILPEEEEKRGMKIYFAVKDEQIIGKIHIQLTGGTAGIYGFGILPQYRKKGYGRSILLKAVKKLKEENVSQIMLQVEAGNEAALNLYKSCGFETTSVMDYYGFSPSAI